MEIFPILGTTRLDELLTASAAHHRRICPRQVIGVRMGLLVGQILEIALPQPDKRLLAISETDGCFVDGISAATGCYVGRRTLRIEDYGKTAATFIDTVAERAIRIAPHSKIRDLAWEYAPSVRNKWEAQLIGYQYIPDDLLLDWQHVKLAVPVQQIVGQAGKRVMCEICGEEIINQREVIREGMVLCKSCAGESYYSFRNV